jgi:hypothetical protein
MSHDIFVQYIPADARSVADIAEHLESRPIGTRSTAISTILAVAPTADFSDPARGVIEGNGFSIEVNLGDDETLKSFAFHLRGGGNEATAIVTEVLMRLGLRAFDPSSATGIFDPNAAAQGFENWQRYRDQVSKHDQ